MSSQRDDSSAEQLVAPRFWVYEYLFARQDRANIDDDELVEFRKLVKAYGGITPKQINRLLQD
ncbi:type II toxin-antitoxin system RelE/ParE family toxin [Granulicella mallensis]|uniref:type II toxin-antitoxin system RelE/ParE family toxin n=1 Tax=Granulicella mallensis TaxID=940614 RepID=UPI0005C7331C